MSKQIQGNGSGASKSPNVKMLKKLQYTDTVLLNNATSTYSYYSKYLKPDITKCVGAAAQFSAYELWRIKKLNVYIQLANPTGSPNATIDFVPSTTIWTAADYGSNETVSGESIMQYQNAKKNTVNLNKWTKIVNTNCRVNCSLDSSGDWNFILPGDTWINTSKFDSSFYSGYQIFVQNFGTQSLGATFQPSFTVNTELIVEFMQPAFQTSPSSFTIQIFDLLMTVQPDPLDPTATRNYVFQSYNVGLVGGVRQITIRLKREDGVPGSLIYTGIQLREAIISGTSGIHFDGRRMIYDGPLPPLEIPETDFDISV